MKKLLSVFELNDEFSAEKSNDFSRDIIYRVEENDTLEKIALKFNCPPSVIIAENNLTEKINFGDLLAINTQFTRLYRISPSDDIDYLTELSGAKTEELLKINRVSYFYPWQLIALGIK